MSRRSSSQSSTALLALLALGLCGTPAWTRFVPNVRVELTRQDRAELAELLEDPNTPIVAMAGWAGYGADPKNGYSASVTLRTGPTRHAVRSVDSFQCRKRNDRWTCPTDRRRFLYSAELGPECKQRLPAGRLSIERSQVTSAAEFRLLVESVCVSPLLREQAWEKHQRPTRVWHEEGRYWLSTMDYGMYRMDFSERWVCAPDRRACRRAWTHESTKVH